MRERKRIFPNKEFKKAWSLASKIDDEQLFIRMLTSSSSQQRIPFEKFGFSYIQMAESLKHIYMYSNLTLKEVLKRANVKKSDISNTFCIPIRTVEDWYYGKNRCPSYIILMILEYYYLLDLGKYTYRESKIYHTSIKPRVYHKIEPKKEEIKKTTIKTNKKDEDVSLKENILLSLQMRSEIYKSTKEQQSTSKSPDILAKTDYLDAILKRRH